MTNSIKNWFQAVRAFSFTASIVPVLTGAAVALACSCRINWWFLPLVIICSLLYHAGTNLLNDYYDHKKQVDADYTFGSSKVIQQGLLKPKQLLLAGVSMLVLGSAIGLIFVYFHGLPILIIGIIGFLGALFYTATPIGYKYIALGDVFVFILMGPLMVVGSFIALTGQYRSEALYISLPIGFLVAAILWSNNLRDIKHDTNANIKTLAILLGHKTAQKGYYILVLVAYISVVVMILTDILPLFSLIVFISLPIAIKNLRTAGTAKPDNPEKLAIIDIQTAQLHLIFGVLLIASLILAKLL